MATIVLERRGFEVARGEWSLEREEWREKLREAEGLKGMLEESRRMLRERDDEHRRG